MKLPNVNSYYSHLLSIIRIGICFFLIITSSSQLIAQSLTEIKFYNDFDSLKTNSETKKALNLHIDICKFIINDSANVKARRLLNISKQNLEFKHIVLLAKARKYLVTRNLNKALQPLEKTLTYYSDNAIQEGTALSYEYFGKIYNKQNELTKSLESFQKALPIYNALKDSAKICKLNIFIGIVSLKTNLLTISKEKFKKAYLIAKKMSYESGEIYALKNLAVTYSKLNQIDSSTVILTNLNEQYQLSQKDKALITANLGSNYHLKNNLKIAKKYYTESLDIKTKLNDSIGISRLLNNLGRLSFQSNDLINAKKFLHKSLALANTQNNIEQKVFNYYNLVELYILTHNSDSSRKYLDLYHVFSDSLNNNKIQKEILELNEKYKAQEKDREIDLMQKEDLLQMAQLKNQEVVIFAVSCVLGVVLLLGYFINRQRRQLKQSQKQLQQQKNEIAAINEELQLSNQAKDRILSIIGHDLRGPVGGIKELMDLYLELPDYEPGDFRKLLRAARESSTSTYHLLENLLNWANTQRGRIAYNPEAITLKPLVEQTTQLLNTMARPKKICFGSNVPECIELYADENMLRTILRNLLSNAVKFSPEESVITIITRLEDKQAIIGIQDQGKGVSGKELDELFKKKETYFLDNKKTAKGTGLGLILCKEFVEYHQGKIWIESKENCGTTVWFTIPLNVTQTDTPENVDQLSASE
ncbi:GHKL domain-containing protein [Marinilabiliaceae bacterium JC017]|nr:GHKL domain-containing protein [Marinilabiliaceae bacterium JC017]